MAILNGLSLFSNIGVAEAYLSSMNIHIAVANELLEERAQFYSAVYPNTEMICGDITDDSIFNKVIALSKKSKIDFILATPPCQGMSTAGKQDENDIRNYLIYYAIKAISQLHPKFVLLENVPQQLKTKISVNGHSILIPNYINSVLDKEYTISNEIVNALDYGVPQMRQRSIYLMVRKDINIKWSFLQDSEKTKPITLAEAIGELPSLDPYIQGYSHQQLLQYFPQFDAKVENGKKVSKWHFPPTHKLRHVEVMKYTPEGCSALDNKNHYPVNSDGSRIKGYRNTYKRQRWDKPGYTVTTYNGAVCSHDNVHPGHFIGTDENGEALFSDARVLSIYELMVLMSLPKDWPIPEWASESLIRHAIGEGIPSQIIKKLFEKLIMEMNSVEKN